VHADDLSTVGAPREGQATPIRVAGDGRDHNGFADGNRVAIRGATDCWQAIQGCFHMDIGRAIGRATSTVVHPKTDRITARHDAGGIPPNRINNAKNPVIATFYLRIDVLSRPALQSGF